jgi:hypothetical protein
MSENYLNPHQTRRGPVSAYDDKLAGAIEEIFGRGAHDLAGLLDGLNRSDVVARDGQPWTETSLLEHLKPYGE